MINFSFDFFKSNMRNTYDITSINNIISSKGVYNSDKLYSDLNNLKRTYPFIRIGSIGKSVLNKDIPYIKIGNGKREVFYSASYHANEWITSILLMKFLSDYCYAYQNNYKIFNYYARSLYEKTTLYIVPMVNPDGVDLVTGKYAINSPIYNFAKNISNSFPNISFPSGWKANLRGENLINFHLSC